MDRQVTIYAAGSLKRAFTELFDVFSRNTGVSVKADFGPAGYMRERLEQGERADLFASADRASPQQLVSGGKASDLQVFARNGLCAVVAHDSPVTTETLLSAMLDPKYRLGTSTPVLDPSGDYAVQVFERAEAIHPGAEKILRDKAQALVGGRVPTPIPSGWVASEYLVASGATDIFLSYSSYQKAMSSSGRIRVIELPDVLKVRADYALVTLNSSGEDAGLLQAFILGEHGQVILQRHGFLVP